MTKELDKKNKIFHPCPRCKKPIEYSLDNDFRPFCCERCKLIDIGAWADGSYFVPGPPAEESEDGLNEQDDGYEEF